MKTLFYLLSFIPLLSELNVFVNTNEYKKERDAWIQDSKDKKYDEWSSQSKYMAIIHLIYMAWLLIGLLSFQWLAFVAILILTLIPKKRIWYMKIDSFLTVLIIIFIILNHFHFRLDLLDLLILN